MALTQKLEIRQSQALVMTPQLMQAIKLLQLSSADLTAYVEDEVERNPLLEHAPETEPVDGEQAVTAAEAEGDAQSGDWLNEDLEVSRTAMEQRLDTDLENVFPDAADGTASPAATSQGQTDWSTVGPGSGNEGDYNLEAFVTAQPTLADHLASQLALAIPNAPDRLIGAHLLDLVDEAGYMRGDINEIAEKLGVALERLRAVLTILQTFDPPGICAQNLSECLAIQLRERNRLDPAMQALLDNMDLLARRDLARLRRVCSVDDEDLSEMIAEIKRLNPKPGAAFESAPVQSLIPDVLVSAAPDGGWNVELNSAALPKVLVNQTYFANVVKSVRNPTEKSYLTDCLQNATWLVRALDQRARTILKVSSEIVRQQDGFFTLGVAHLRPLNLRTVADAIGMHESTVSRVTANKVMATPRGIFELKYFFTTAISAANGGDAHSSEAVRHHIKQLIEKETAGEILSDDNIVEKLHSAGIDIARRTVAKYREAMRIPSSVQRRRDKQSPAGMSL
jgi:RNA polymerase sigma-54 factor